MILAGQLHAADVHIDDTYGDDFVNYQPYVVKGAKKPESKPPVPEMAPKKTNPFGEQKVTVKWLQENYKILEEKAIDNPTDDNVTAFLYTKRIALDKAQRFSEKVMSVTNQDPFLNENNRIPYASAGAQSVQNANLNAQQSAVRELAAVGGLIIFVDGACRFCSMQMPIIKMLHNLYGLETLVVSLDGKHPNYYTGEIVKDNGLFHKLKLKLTPSIVYVHKPKGYVNGKDNNVYRIVSQGFYAENELEKQIAFAGHSTNILSKETMRGLDVWDVGVASTEDMNQLMLNSEKPGTFKQKLQPLLQKQY